jgi:hypothetical protein
MRASSRRPSYDAGSPSLPPPPEVVVPLRTSPHDITPVTRVRTTLVHSSRRALEKRNLLAAYSTQLSRADRAALENLVPGRWLGMDLAMAHYRAVDALQLPLSDQLALGGNVADIIQGTLIGTLLRMASQGLRLTPWTGVNQYARIWDRLFMGGDLMVEKLGPREAVVTMYKLPLLGIPYFRVALRGVQEIGLSAIYSWHKLHVSELSSAESSAKYRLTWV